MRVSARAHAGFSCKGTTTATKTGQQHQPGPSSHLLKRHVQRGSLPALAGSMVQLGQYHSHLGAGSQKQDTPQGRFLQPFPPRLTHDLEHESFCPNVPLVLADLSGLDILSCLH